MLKIVLTLTMLAVLLPAHSHAWLICHKPAFQGKVLDAETKQPIEGAVVVVVYERIVAGIGPGWSAFPFDAKETLTGNDGTFRVSSYTTLIHPFAFNSFVRFIIYKPGYGRFSPVNIGHKTEFGLELQERFFSENFGKRFEILLSPDITSISREKYTLTFGVVELAKLKTDEERRSVWMSANIFSRHIKPESLPILDKYIKEGAFAK